MLDKETIRMARKKSWESRRNPVRITQEHWDGADKLLREHEAFEAGKDRDIEREQGQLAKDVGSFTYNFIRGNIITSGLRKEVKNPVMCQADECYTCHVSLERSMWNSEYRPAKKIFYKSGLEGYCVRCFFSIFLKIKLTKLKKRFQKYIAEHLIEWAIDWLFNLKYKFIK